METYILLLPIDSFDDDDADGLHGSTYPTAESLHDFLTETFEHAGEILIQPIEEFVGDINSGDDCITQHWTTYVYVGTDPKDEVIANQRHRMAELEYENSVLRRKIEKLHFPD